MTPKQVARARWVAQEVARDVEADAFYYDGRPFNGREVAEYMGKTAAAVSALAHLVDALLVASLPYAVEPEECPG